MMTPLHILLYSLVEGKYEIHYVEIHGDEERAKGAE
jgi:hypothetical protein